MSIKWIESTLKLKPQTSPSLRADNRAARAILEIFVIWGEMGHG